MKPIQLLKKYWYIYVSLLFILLLTPLCFENFPKALVVISIIVIWNILGVLLKDFIKSSLLTIFLTLSFNITYQLPYSVFGLQLADPFVDGVIVNYLVPIVSILDISVILLLLSMFFSKKINLEWEGFSFLKIFTLFASYLIVQSVLKGSFLSLFNSFRLLLYLFTFYNLFKNIKSVLNQKTYIYLLIGSIFLVLFQGVVALLQFSGGSSLGLSFLGESHVVSGMSGSSFLNLNDSLYLRGYGTFPHPNVFAGWLIFNILLGCFLFENMNKKRDYAIVLMILSSLVLILTFSRISFFVCVIVWVAFLVKVFIDSKGMKSFAFLGLLSERVLNLFNSGDTSWSDRVGLMRSSFHIIKTNILTGVGLGRFVANMDDTVPRSSSNILLLQPVHNVFLLIVSEIGLIGFSLFGTLLYFFFKNREWSLRFVMGLIAIFIISMFDHYLFSLPQGLGMLFLLLCF